MLQSTDGPVLSMILVKSTKDADIVWIGTAGGVILMCSWNKVTFPSCPSQLFVFNIRSCSSYFLSLLFIVLHLLAPTCVAFLSDHRLHGAT
jgi:hypothetical protein